MGHYTYKQNLELLFISVFRQQVAMGVKLAGEEEVGKLWYTCQFLEGNKLGSMVHLSSLSLLLGSSLSQADNCPPLSYLMG